MNGPTCQFCVHPATVFRAYEGENPEVFLCAECCAERGWEKVCWPVKDHPNHPDNIDPDEDDEEPAEGSMMADGWGCEFPEKCVMPGRHLKSECHTAEDLAHQEDEKDAWAEHQMRYPDKS